MNKKEAIEKAETKVGRKVIRIKKFESAETFSALHEAHNMIKQLGGSIGSMCANEPIAFVNRKDVRIAKWNNISSTEYSNIDGVIISEDFRNGNVFVADFA